MRTEELNSHASVEVEVTGSVGQGEVVAGQLRLGHIEGHLVTG